jgi:hypothetical protein
MPQPPATTAHPPPPDDDASLLARLGYVQELSRTLGAFSNFAISLSIICILAGGITSFHIGYCSVGGAAIGLGWPLVCVFSLAVALSMAQFLPRAEVIVVTTPQTAAQGDAFADPDGDPGTHAARCA